MGKLEKEIEFYKSKVNQLED